jgi:hypothetical protein
MRPNWHCNTPGDWSSPYGDAVKWPGEGWFVQRRGEPVVGPFRELVQAQAWAETHQARRVAS